MVKKDNGIGCIPTLIIFLICTIGFIISCNEQIERDEKYGSEPHYEFVVLEKYEKIGSSFHIWGGRASETEYHIVYKYRCTNRPEKRCYKKWIVDDDEVKYKNYRIINVGDRYTNNILFFPYS